MEAAMKQTVATKQLLEKDYQKLSGYYDTAKVNKMQHDIKCFNSYSYNAATDWLQLGCFCVDNLF